MFWPQMLALSTAQTNHTQKIESEHRSQFPDQFRRCCQNRSRTVDHLSLLLVWR